MNRFVLCTFWCFYYGDDNFHYLLEEDRCQLGELIGGGEAQAHRPDRPSLIWGPCSISMKSDIAPKVVDK